MPNKTPIHNIRTQSHLVLCLPFPQRNSNPKPEPLFVVVTVVPVEQLLSSECHFSHLPGFSSLLKSRLAHRKKKPLFVHAPRLTLSLSTATLLPSPFFLALLPSPFFSSVKVRILELPPSLSKAFQFHLVLTWFVCSLLHLQCV